MTSRWENLKASTAEAEEVGGGGNLPPLLLRALLEKTRAPMTKLGGAKEVLGEQLRVLLQALHQEEPGNPWVTSAVLRPAPGLLENLGERESPALPTAAGPDALGRKPSRAPKQPEGKALAPRQLP